MLHVTGKDIELFGQLIRVDVSDDIILVVKESAHQPAVVGVEMTEPGITDFRQRVEPLTDQEWVFWIHEGFLLIRHSASGSEGLLHG